MRPWRADRPSEDEVFKLEQALDAVMGRPPA
jgi:hypothetical protein